MKLVYVAGPFRGPSSWAIELNVREAETLALDVWRLGAAAICPHANTRFFQNAAPDEIWLEGDLEILSRCDAMIVTENWENSEGTKREIKEANTLAIPVFYNLYDLAEWLKTVGA